MKVEQKASVPTQIMELQPTKTERPGVHVQVLEQSRE